MTYLQILEYNVIQIKSYNIFNTYIKTLSVYYMTLISNTNATYYNIKPTKQGS